MVEEKKRSRIRPETQLAQKFLVPFLNGCWDLKQRLAKGALADEELMKAVRALVTPTFKWVLQESFPDQDLEGDIARHVEYSFSLSACKEMLSAADMLREMIAVGSNCDECELQPRSQVDTLIAWVREHVGQTVWVPASWGYNNVRVFARPKRIDGSPGVSTYDWGAPQLISLYIYWLIHSYDVSLTSGNIPSGEYFIGVCPFCGVTFPKTHRVSKQICGKLQCQNLLTERNKSEETGS